MPGGYKSLLGFWIGGIYAPSAAPEPSCPCPDWTVEGSLLDTFRKDQTLQNSFTQKAEESTNRWRKKNCE